MSKKAQIKLKAIIITAVSILLAIPLIILPLSAVVVYEATFGMTRYETAPWLEQSVEDFDGLSVERSDFVSDGVTLAGYKYKKADTEPVGVVVISHGLGGGGQNTYMPFADCFTDRGYYVFAYDACGNDNSEGDSVEGLPRGIVDLDGALEHIKTVEEYNALPVMLFGHSWGAYSVGCVLAMHPEVRAAVLVAGFNESEDLLLYQGKQLAGVGAGILLPYMELYERIKFGSEFSDISAVEAMSAAAAGIMIVHSKNDATVPTAYGYDKFYDEFGDSERFEFVLYEDRGHDYLFYSDAAWDYREELNARYKSYIEDNGREYNAENKQAFMDEYLDKKQCFEPNPELVEQIIEMYNTYGIK